MMTLWDLELLNICLLLNPSSSQTWKVIIWLNPPSSLLGSYLSHYLLCKQSFPHDISACILVQHCSLSKLACRGLLRGMQELHTHFGTASVDGPPQLKAKAHVYFDPPMPRILTALHSSQSLQFITQAKVGGFPCGYFLIQMLLTISSTVQPHGGWDLQLHLIPVSSGVHMLMAAVP